MTEALIHPQIPLKEIKVYEIFERLRQGETYQEIAEDLGIAVHHVRQYLKELAASAREHMKDQAAHTFLVSDLRYNDLYRKSYEIATDETAEKDTRLRALGQCLLIQSKITDLHQIGRANKVTNNLVMVAGEDMTEEQAEAIIRQSGLRVPRDLGGQGD